MLQVVLIILDGFGVAKQSTANPRTKARTPTFNRLEAEAFALTLQASGVGVGLPWGEPGNSEVGHLTMGAGRLLYHALPRIIVAIRDGSFFTNAALRSAFDHVRKTHGQLHVMGLVSSGSVHSYIDHLYAIFEMAVREKTTLALHAFTDGRDAEPHEAQKFLPQIEDRMRAMGIGRIASICGRSFSMDRDGQWQKTEQAYRLLVEGRGERAASVGEALAVSYARGLTDDVMPPTVIVDTEGAPSTIRSGDALIFFNFREDSARQLAAAFGSPTFDKFERAALHDFQFVTLTEYARGLHAIPAFPPLSVTETLGEVVAERGLSQLRIAETDKYAHVTYFFNGGVEPPFPREQRILIPSLADVRADEDPMMRAPEITDTIIRAIEGRTHDLVIANYANADMVGHTGNFRACSEAIEALDEALARVLVAAETHSAVLFITADHGNVEEKRDLVTGRPLTEHSLNPVPFFAVGAKIPAAKGIARLSAEDRPRGLLADIAPTVLALLGIPKPAVMTGRNLLAVSSP